MKNIMDTHKVAMDVITDSILGKEEEHSCDNQLGEGSCTHSSHFNVYGKD